MTGFFPLLTKTEPEVPKFRERSPFAHRPWPTNDACWSPIIHNSGILFPSIEISPNSQQVGVILGKDLGFT